jgi:hypothetical protein
LVVARLLPRFSDSDFNIAARFTVLERALLACLRACVLADVAMRASGKKSMMSGPIAA